MSEGNPLEVYENHVVFKGRCFYPPYHCLCCGVEVSLEQFCYGRLCGFCDTGACQYDDHKHYIGFRAGHGRQDIFESAPLATLVKDDRYVRG